MIRRSKDLVGERYHGLTELSDLTVGESLTGEVRHDAYEADVPFDVALGTVDAVNAGVPRVRAILEAEGAVREDQSPAREWTNPSLGFPKLFQVLHGDIRDVLLPVLRTADEPAERGVLVSAVVRPCCHIVGVSEHLSTFETGSIPRTR